MDFCHPLKEKPQKDGSITGHSRQVRLSAPQLMRGVFLQASTTLVEPWRPNRSTWKEKGLVAQFWPALCNPMDYSPPGSSVHRVLQARILEWIAIPFSRWSSQPRDWTGLLHGRWLLYHLSHQGSPLWNRWKGTWSFNPVFPIYRQENWGPTKGDELTRF